MAEINTDQIVEQLGSLSVMQILALTKQLEEKWGVKATAPAIVAPTPTPTNVSDVGEEKTEFDVILASVTATDKKIAVIKAVREITGLGLKEAKELVEGLPKPIKEGVGRADAESIRAKIVEAGGTVDLK